MGWPDCGSTADCGSGRLNTAVLFSALLWFGSAVSGVELWSSSSSSPVSDSWMWVSSVRGGRMDILRFGWFDSFDLEMEFCEKMPLRVLDRLTFSRCGRPFLFLVVPHRCLCIVGGGDGINGGSEPEMMDAESADSNVTSAESANGSCGFWKLTSWSSSMANVGEARPP